MQCRTSLCNAFMQCQDQVKFMNSPDRWVSVVLILTYAGRVRFGAFVIENLLFKVGSLNDLYVSALEIERPIYLLPTPAKIMRRKLNISHAFQSSSVTVSISNEWQTYSMPLHTSWKFMSWRSWDLSSASLLWPRWRFPWCPWRCLWLFPGLEFWQEKSR